MRLCLLVAAATLMSNTALAQTGPLQPRLVMSAFANFGPMPTEDSSGDKGVVVELFLGIDGKVTEVAIEESSGNANFDKKVQRYYQKWRLLPALDENGTPIPSTIKLRFKLTALNSPPPVAPKTDPKDSRVYDETARIARMKCKDFVWEYDLMKQIAGREFKPLNEQLLRTSMAMFMVQEKITANDLSAMNHSFDKTLRDTLEICGQKSDASYFQDAFAPTLKTQMQH